MSVGLVGAGSRIEVSRLPCHLRSWGCPQSRLPPRALSGSVVLLQWEEGSGGACSLSVLSPETMWRPMIHAPTDCEEQGGYFCCDINDCRYRLRAEDMDRFCEDLSSHSLSQSNILEGSH